ncbi:glycosyltransferase [Sabulicella glaciei]|uniref:Glycosyltransferase n=1 Tax=Sabulicella glaciei TaxID=2984948 RepID=A0ABT3NRK6_9PROT|nr:glycosyltransferase [Roseococcus sp. MDT2-1-1]
MKAPLLLHVFPGFAVGGAQVRFAMLANRMGPRWRHAIVSLNGRMECAERLAADVSWERVPFAAEGSLPQRLQRTRALLRTVRPDLLLTSNWGSIEWAMANAAPGGVPHIHMEDGFGPDEARGQKARRVWTRRLVLRRAETVLPSATLLEASRHLWRLPEARTHLIPNGLDLARFAPGGQGGDGLPVIGTVAALRAEKNIGRLLRACALLAGEGLGFRLLIVGEGEERAGLEALAGELGLAGRTRFAGHMPDPAAAYREMDVFALSSDTEQMPFSVMEAMASGLPVASTSVGDVRRMLPPEQERFLAPCDDVALAGALRPLLCDAALRRELGAANRLVAERDLDQDRMFSAHASLIERLLMSRAALAA